MNRWPLMPMARRVGTVFLPAIILILAQVIFFPMPPALVIQGVIIGLLGALVAVGMALIYRANRVLNFAQAQLGLVPVVLAGSLIIESGINYYLAVTCGLLSAIVLGSVIEVVIIRRFFRSPRLILTVATIGLSQLLVAFSLFLPTLWGSQPVALVVHVPISFQVSIFPMVFTADDVSGILFSIVTLVGIAIMLRFTNLGIAVRASAERADRANLLGIPVTRLQTVVWALAAVMSFVAVMLEAGILGLPLGLSLSYTVLLAALSALVLGNFVNLPAITVSAVALGILQQGVLWDHVNDPEYFNLVLAIVVVLALLVRRMSTSRADNDSTSTWVASDEIRPIPKELRFLRPIRAVRGIGFLVIGIVLLLIPYLFRNDVGNQLKASAVVVFIIITISVVVLTGWSGQISLGQMSFVGFGAAVGAYGTSVWHLDAALALLLSGVVTAAIAAVISIPTLRLKGIFPAVTTLAFALATTAYLLNANYFSWIPVDRVNRPELFGFISLNSQASYYYFSLGTLAVVILGVQGIRRSRSGRVLMAIRENERGAQSYGVNVIRAKLLAFTISGFIAGIAGCVYVHLLQGFDMSVYGPDQSVLVFSAAVVGGLGSLLGAGLGAVYLLGGQWFLPSTQWQVLASGAGMLLVLMALPGGLGSVVFRLRDRFLRWFADRNDIVVPSLLADSAVEVSPADAVVHSDHPTMTEADAEAALSNEVLGS